MSHLVQAIHRSAPEYQASLIGYNKKQFIVCLRTLYKESCLISHTLSSFKQMLNQIAKHPSIHNGKKGSYVRFFMV